jgi:hypothetical protein
VLTDEQRLATDISPPNFLDAFPLNNFQQRGQHYPFMQTAFAQVRRRWAILHHFDDFPYIVSFGCSFQRLNELDRTSVISVSMKLTK